MGQAHPGALHRDLILAGVTAWFLELPEKYLIHVPLNVFEHGIVLFPISLKPWQRTDL